MTEFVGRTGSNRVYSYPETRRGAGDPLTAFARNYALNGPKSGPVAIGPAGIQVPWGFVEAGTPPTSADVPITPKATGIVLVTGVLEVANSSGGSLTITVNLQVDGLDLPGGPTINVTIPDVTSMVIPILIETTPGDTPIGVTSQIEVFVAGDGAFLTAGSTLEVQEVSIASG